MKREFPLFITAAAGLLMIVSFFVPHQIASVPADFLQASAIIMLHNHPSGDPTPSKDDVTMTKAVAAAAEKLGILLHDHVVVGRKGHASLRSLGLLG